MIVALPGLFSYFFLSVSLYVGMAAILFNGAESFEQIVNVLSTEGPM